jgi:hypothetical protein
MLEPGIAGRYHIRANRHNIRGAVMPENLLCYGKDSVGKGMT